MKKSYLSLVMLTIMSLIVSACSSEGEGNANASSDQLTFSTGTTSGVYYPLGALLATHWTNGEAASVSAQASNGSVENLKMMQSGNSQLALSTVNIIWEAFNGEKSFQDEQYGDVRILANLYPNVSHIIALDDADIETVKDIEGKSFVYGAAGSATELESKLVLSSHGVDLETVNENYVGFGEAVDLMRNKQVQGVNIYTGVPAAGASELISTVDSKVISFTDEAIQAMTDDENPWNFEYLIEQGTYEGQEEDVRTVGQFSSIAIDANVSEDVVYEMTKSLWESLEELEEGHAVAKQFNLEEAVKGTADVPLHPGAERYYKEVGVLE